MIRARNWDSSAAHSTPPVAAHPDRACAGADVRVFFPMPGNHARAAREICGRCPHKTPCLEWALETDQQFGILGGASPDERARMTSRRAAA